MEVRKIVLMPYPAEAMFDLIEQAEHYPQFIPYCTHAVILERCDDWVGAVLTMTVAGIPIAVETRNPKRRPEWLALRMVRGPLARFDGEWRLTPLNAEACRIEFTLRYEFAAGLLSRAAAAAFTRMADLMVDAYVARAERTLPPPRPLTAAPVPSAPPTVSTPLPPTS